jgi:hypothetical protein
MAILAVLNPFRRREVSLTASAEEVDLSDEKAINAALKRREDWQETAVKQFDMVGEIQNGCTQVADLMSGLLAFAAKKPSNTDAQPERDTDSVAKETADRLGSIVEVQQLLYDMSMQILLVGETQLLGVQARPEMGIYRETWMAYSHLELEKASVRKTDEDGNEEVIDSVAIPDFFEGQALVLDPSKGDTWIRIWRPHPILKSKANSHVRSLIGVTDELLWWDWAAAAVAKARLATAGLVGLPSNIELPAEAGEDPRSKDSTRFARRMKNIAIKTLQNPSAASAAIPIIFTYPWNDKGKSGVEAITFERPADELLEKRTERSLRRIAQGFPLPVESFFGIGSASQWGSREISETKFRENVEPFARFVFAALTTHWYQPILRAEGVDDWYDRVLWFDASGVIVHPDITQAADKGVEYGFVSGKGWRRIRGIRESDAPDEKERAEQLAWLRNLKGRDLSLPGQENEGSPDEPTKQVSHQGNAPKEQPAATVRGKGQPVLSSANGHPPSPDLGRRLAEIDADLFARVHVMADSSMRRALEKAGNKLKNRAGRNQRLKQSLRGVAAEEVASTLGREAVVQLGMNDLFDDSFETVPFLFASWCDRAVEAAFVVSGLEGDKRKDAAFQLACGTDEAAQSLIRELREHAATLLFDCASSDIPQPEADDLIVPASIVRRALSIAGGSPKKEAGITLLATGPAVLRSLNEVGLYASGWTWWKGPAPRAPHQAHQRLDGTIIDLTKPLTASPGDTRDCKCLVVPEFA